MSFIKEILLAVRSLRRSPVFTLAAVAALTLAIGANTTVFSVVKALLNVPIPISEPDRVAFLFSDNQERNLVQGPMSVDDFLDIREATTTSFEGVSALTLQAFSVVGAGDPVRIQGSLASPGFFKLTQQNMTMGRGFLDHEGTPGRNRVTILGYGFWQQQMGGDPAAIGKTINLDGINHEIVGVAEDGFFFPTPQTLLWTPLVLDAGRTARDQRTLFGLGRLREGVDSTTASTEMATIASQLELEYPETNEGWTASTQTISENLFQGVSFAVALLYGAISLVLLIACANVANLLLARSISRERELALRSSLGAGRARLVRQLLIEAATLSLVSSFLGLVVAFWGVELLRNWIAPAPGVGFIAAQIQLDGGVVLHSAAVAGVSALLFGVLPALQMTGGNLVLALRDGGRGGSGGPRRRWLRSGLVAGEVAMALALLLTSTALIRAFNSIYEADPGFEPAGLVAADLALPDVGYEEPEQRIRFFEELVLELSTTPGVEFVASTTVLPLTLPPGPGSVRVVAEGEEVDDKDSTPNALDVVVTPNYFDTMKIQLTRGRNFTEVDRADSDRVAVITESMVKRHWPQTDPIGRRLRIERPGQLAAQQAAAGADADGAGWVTVVGVVEDVASHSHSLRTPTRTPQIFLPLAQTPSQAMTVVARATGDDPLVLADALRSAVWNIDSTLPVDNARTVEQAIARI
ncbi:MAG: ADOP family duplicated permease, partial [Acidimicrobiales bacterium]